MPINISFPTRHQVCVITSFNIKGDIRIDAWGIEFDNKRYKYKVESSTLIEEVDAYLKFRCLYIESGLLKSINLVFYRKNHRWTTE